MANRLHQLVSLWLLMQTAACDSPTEQQLPPPPEKPTLHRVDELTPGQKGRVYGKHLSRLSSLSVDGQGVQMQVVGDTLAEFTVPALRSCEVDGRTVAISSERQGLSGKIRLPGATHLEVGESRMLSAGDLKCLPLSQEAGTYVLSVISLAPEASIDTVFRLTSRGADAPPGANPSLSLSPSLSDVRVQGPDDHGSRRLLFPGEVSLGAAQRSEPGAAFDPRMATAQVGDTVVLVDFTRPEAVTSTTREGVPTYRARVVALSGETVLLVDTRLPNAANYFTPAVQQKLARAAQIADAYGLRAIRAVIDPGFQPLQGAGGRRFAVFSTLGNNTSLGGADGYNLAPRSEWRWSSEVMVALLNPDLDDPRYDVSMIASTILHEHAHVADAIPAVWGTGLRSQQGWYGEALARNVEEVAARMHLGAESQARAASLTGNDLRVAAPEFPSSLAEQFSPWGIPGVERSSSPSSYTVGASLLLFAREQLGMAGFAPGSTLHQRLVQRAMTLPRAEWHQAFTVRAIAAELGWSAEELMDRHAMAILTDDLVPDEAARKYQLHRLRSWDNQRPLSSAEDYLALARGESRLLWRAGTKSLPVQAPAGSGHFLYIPSDPGKGISLEASEVRLGSHHRVRLTRLR